MHQNPPQLTVFLLLTGVKVDQVGDHQIQPLKFYLSKMKGLLLVTELLLVSSSDADSAASDLCDTACRNSWVSNTLVNRFGLHGAALKLRIKDMNIKVVIDRKLVELTKNRSAGDTLFLIDHRHFRQICHR